MYEIEKGVPIPAPHQGRGRPANGLTNALRSMDVGDCILVGRTQKQLGSYIYMLNSNGMKFTTRKEGESTRIWRVA